METVNPSNTCGNCGAANPADAMVCVSCGVVLAAYATPPAEPAPPSGGESRPAPTREPLDRLSPSATGQDWRSLFERPDEPLGPEPPAAAAATPDSIDPLDREDVRMEAAGHVPVRPAPRPSTRSATAPPAGARGGDPAPPPARRRPPAGREAQAQGRPGGEPGIPRVGATTVADPRAANRALRSQMRSPLWIMYGGIGLLLGGCVLSLLLALVNSNSSLTGFVFICTVPIGIVLFAIGYIRVMMRKEGRAKR